jgi:hypothetical protein
MKDYEVRVTAKHPAYTRPPRITGRVARVFDAIAESHARRGNDEAVLKTAKRYPFLTLHGAYLKAAEDGKLRSRKEAAVAGMEFVPSTQTITGMTIHIGKHRIELPADATAEQAAVAITNAVNEDPGINVSMRTAEQPGTVTLTQKHKGPIP